MGVITDNTHTISQVVSWNSEGERVFLDWNSEDTGWGGVGDNTVWNSNCMGGGGGGVQLSSALNFQRGKTEKASIEIPDMLTFPVCKSSKNRPWKQDKDRSGGFWRSHG